jgi:membrane protease YdiL (CAAX protease family)
MWPLLRGSPFGEYRRALGLHTGRGVVREIGAGLVGYLAGLPVLLVAVFVASALTRITHSLPSHPIENEIRADWRSALQLYALASLWAPLTEELMFRGAFFAHLRRKHGWLVSASVVSIIFAVVHPQGIVGVPAIFTIGLTLAAIREWRGTILASMVAHALNNGALVTLLIFAMG